MSYLYYNDEDYFLEKIRAKETCQESVLDCKCLIVFQNMCTRRDPSIKFIKYMCKYRASVGLSDPKLSDLFFIGKIW